MDMNNVKDISFEHINTQAQRAWETNSVLKTVFLDRDKFLELLHNSPRDVSIICDTDFGRVTISCPHRKVGTNEV